ncbi:hypothetical protein C6Q09_19405 [Burkholderia multivorans]|nr:hypothetical protein C6Q09_19405 [Burkholderia multivorans]
MPFLTPIVFSKSLSHFPNILFYLMNSHFMIDKMLVLSFFNYPEVQLFFPWHVLILHSFSLFL